MINVVGELLLKASEKQLAMIQQPSFEAMEEYYHEIKECETQSDKEIAKIYDELNDSFITPFDREDIHSLCETVDDTLDYINSTSKRILLFRPASIPEVAVEIAKAIVECSKAIQIALSELKTVNKKPELALKQCEILHDLEAEVDEMYEHFVKKLFEKETNAIEIIKIKEIVQHMERTSDMAKHVGKIIKTIIVKYA
ncbi:MAG: DUF47 family protein [Bacteroidales bacterium]|nr:DUF47 family protein [Bacteroidales bacterium]